MAKSIDLGDRAAVILSVALVDYFLGHDGNAF
jgi:hypothetical protein